MSDVSSATVSDAAPPAAADDPAPAPARKSGMSKAIGGAILGAILVVGAIGTLFWNEHRAAIEARSLAEGGQSVQEASPDRVHAIQDGKLIHLSGPVVIPGTLSDPDVPAMSVPHAAVMRRAVETYQWHEGETTKNGQTRYSYSRGWYDRIIDSNLFHEQQGHTNYPPTYTETQVVAPGATIGARHVPPALLGKLTGGQVLVPPANRIPPGTQLFEGGLYVGNNPGVPQIGDQRVRWTVIQPAALSVIAGQRGADLVPYHAAAGNDLHLIQADTVPAAEMIHRAEVEDEKFTWAVRGAGAAAMFAGFVLVLSPFAVLGSFIPVLGQVIGVGVMLIGLALTLILAPVIIGAGMVTAYPLRAAIVAGAGLLLGFSLTRINRAWQTRRRRTKPALVAALTLLLVSAALPAWAQPTTVPPKPGETALWDAVRNSNEPDDVQAYLDAYPQGAYAMQARERIATLGPAPAPLAPARPAPAPPAAPATQQAASTGHACDRLAEPPHGAMGNAAPTYTPAGVADDQVDLTAARAACTAAMAERPNEPRFVAYLARVLDQSNELPDSKKLYRRAAELGNPFAAYVIGGDLLLGRDGTPVDTKEAVRFLKQAANGGVLYALIPMGDWSLSGENGVPKDEQEAARYYRMAADQGDAEGQLDLALMIQRGKGGLAKNDGEILRLLRAASAQGNMFAEYQLGAAYAVGAYGLVRDDTEAVRLFRLAAEQNMAEAQVYLGTLYDAGRGGLPRDKVAAARYYRLAADQNTASGQVRLARYYEDGDGGLPQDRKEALKLYRLAAAQGDRTATEAVARLQQQAVAAPAPRPVAAAPAVKTLCDDLAEPPPNQLGKDAPRLTPSGVPGFQMAREPARDACTAAIAKQPDEARFVAYLGRALQQSLDPGASVQYRRASDMGNAFASYAVADMLLTSVAPADTEAGMVFLRRAVDARVPDALDLMGGFYLTGQNGLARDEREAARLLQMAADQGSADGQAHFALMILRGQGGVARDDREFLRLIQAAAEKSQPEASFHLGLAYMTGGLGLARDDERAVQLLENAALGGVMGAAFTLGQLQEAGRGGLDPNRDEALALYRIDAANGNQSAIAAVARLEKQALATPAKPVPPPPAPVAPAPAPVASAPSPVPMQPGNPPAPAASAGSAPATECDRLAEPPREWMPPQAPSYTKSGMLDRQIDAPAVQAACMQAAAEYPAEPRFIAYSARALEMSNHQPESARLYRLAADRGNAFAQMTMAICYIDGLFGLPKDDAAAQRYLRLAAAQDVAPALVRLGQWYNDGTHGVARDQVETVRLYARAAQLHDTQGQISLGVMYAQGAGGLKQDGARALQLFGLAAKAGDPEGDLYAGQMYETGFGGVAPNQVEAVRLYQAAAAAGSAESQYRLGLMFEEGRGVPKDRRAALAMMKAAADQGWAGAAAKVAALQQPERPPAPQTPARAGKPRQ